MIKKFIVLLFLICFSSLLYAQNSLTDKEDNQQSMQTIERTRKVLLDQFHRLTTNIDEFFSNSDSLNEENDSYMNLGLLTTLEDNETAESNFIVRTHLSLPNTEKRFHLFLTQFKDDYDDFLNKTDNDLGAGLRLDYLQRKDVSLQTSAGVKVRRGLKIFTKIRLRHTLNYKVWTSRYIQSVFWFDSEGYEYKSEMYWDKELTPILLFRLHTGLSWGEIDRITYFNHTYNLIHTFDKHHALVYTIGFEATDEPTWHSETYKLNVNLRKLIYQDWLYINLAPGTVWRKEDGFITRSQVFFGINAILGTIQ